MQYDMKSLDNQPYYNLAESIDQYGFDLESFMEDGSAQFIKETYINNFIEFRKSYLQRDYERVRFWAHKFKGSFSLLRSKIVEQECLKMQKCVDVGNIDVEDIYVQIVQGMTIFLQKLSELAQKLNNPISKVLVARFHELNGNCDYYEDYRVKRKLLNDSIIGADLISNYESSLGQTYNFESHEPNTRYCCNFNKNNCNIL